LKRTALAILLVTLSLSACRTIGFAREKGGYAIVAPTVANEMILDNRQVIVIDIRSAADFDGPGGHVAGAISAPLDQIETQLPLLVPYQNSTLLVYGNDDEDGARGARVLVAAGFRNVVLIKGGLSEWRTKKYRTVVS
jgi:rhodanese-related sulfurtransferase